MGPVWTGCTIVRLVAVLAEPRRFTIGTVIDGVQLNAAQAPDTAHSSPPNSLEQT